MNEDLLKYIKNPVGWEIHLIGYYIKHSKGIHESISNFSNGILHYRYNNHIGEEGIEIWYEHKRNN